MSAHSELPVLPGATSLGGPAEELVRWLQILFFASPAAIGFSRDGLMLDANPAYLKLFGLAREELRGTSLLNQIAPSHRADILTKIRRRAAGEFVPATYETRGLRKDGSEFPFEITTNRVPAEDGPLTLAFITDASERVKIRNELTELLDLNQRLLNASTMGCLVYLAEGQCIFANAVIGRIIGSTHAQMNAQNFRQIESWKRSGMLEAALRTLETGVDQHGLFHLLTSFGREIWLDTQFTRMVRAGQTLLFAFMRDATPEKLAEAARRESEARQHELAERMRHAQKLESLGMLAGGIAHDFNNLLTAILSSNELALLEAPPGMRIHLDTIRLGARRAAELCSQMLAYAGKAPLALGSIDLNGVVEETGQLLDASVTQKAQLQRALAAPAPVIQGDATQLRQVLMNLVINASEAQGPSGGVIRIATGHAHPPLPAELPEGRYAWLEVEDSGCGMDPATSAQMFDPFFTTKFAGRGLGMAAVQGIVRSHSGWIEVSSAQGRGSRIRIYLPERGELPAVVQPPVAAPLEGRGTVLIVDDQRTVRITTRMLIQTLGFQALEAAGGVEALALFKAHRKDIVAVVLDLTMPEMNGGEVLVALRHLDPKVRVILTTGYSTVNLETSGGQERADAVLGKPFTMEQLTETLRRVTGKNASEIER